MMELIAFSKKAEDFLLSPLEMKLIQNFRCLRDDAQEILARTLDKSAQNPSLRRTPSLRLVSDGRKST